jgi:hypothetical protein
MLAPFLAGLRKRPVNAADAPVTGIDESRFCARERLGNPSTDLTGRDYGLPLK